MNRLFRITILSLIFATLAGSAFALGSKEKSPEETAADNQKKATQEYNEGVKHMKKADEIAQKGDSAYAFNYRATSDAKAQKELEKAVEQFTKAIELDPKLKEAHNNLGYTYRKLGKLPESIASYEKALAIDSMFADAREYLGETYLAMGELDKAMGEQERLKAMDSPLAATLMKSIDMYKLMQVSKEMEHGK